MAKRELRLDLSTVVTPITQAVPVVPYKQSFVDIAFLRRIYHQCWPKGHRSLMDQYEWHSYIQDTGVSILMSACGFIEYHPDEGQSVFVELLAVSPPHQRQGNGTSLIGVVINEARHNNLRRVILHTTEDVQPFYTRLGFEFYREVLEDG